MNRKTKGIFYLAGALIGGLAGFLYYRFVGCVSGACPITSNPLVAMPYGAVIGVLVASILIPGTKKEKQDNPED